MAKNLVSDLILAPLAQILDMLDTFASYHCKFKENYRTKLEKMTKNLVWVDFGPFGQNSDRQFFFSFKNLVSSVTKYDKLSSCTISEETNYLVKI